MIADPDDLDTMVRTLSGECRGESLVGQHAVAWVIKNRAEWKPPAWWGHTIGQVCRKKHQFSCWSDANFNASNLAHMMRLQQTDSEYIALETVCLDVLGDKIVDPTNGATHYRVVGTTASWDQAINETSQVQIGRHLFCRIGPF